MNSEDAFVQRIESAPAEHGPLNGLTFAVKDVIDVAGTVTGCGNPTWAATHDPAVAHAVAVELLLQSGARCVGKTISDEFAFSLVGENHFYGTPKNHRAPDRVPGGSSSGSASAVASGEVDFAIGTDTAGSVRVPAANCGLLGLRSTLGRHPLAGVQSLAPSFDTLGVFTRDAETMRRLGRIFYPVQSRSATRVFLLEEAWGLADADVRALRPVVDARFRELDLDVRVTRLDSLADDDLGRDPFAWKQLFSDVQWPEVWSVFGSWVERHASDIGPKIAENFHMVRERGRAGYAAAFKKQSRRPRRAAGFLRERSRPRHSHRPRAATAARPGRLRPQGNRLPAAHALPQRHRRYWRPPGNQRPAHDQGRLACRALPHRRPLDRAGADPIGGRLYGDADLSRSKATLLLSLDSHRASHFGFQNPVVALAFGGGGFSVEEDCFRIARGDLDAGFHSLPEAWC